MLSTLSPVALSQRYSLSSAEKKKQPSAQRAGLKPTGVSVKDSLSLSSKKHLGNHQLLLAQKSSGLSSRSTGVKTQAVLNPLSATRNPINETEFDQVLEDLTPIAPGLKDQAKVDKQALFRKMIINTNQLVAEVSRIWKDGNSVKLIVYREGEHDPKKYRPIYAGTEVLSDVSIPHITGNKIEALMDELIHPFLVGLIVFPAMGSHVLTDPFVKMQKKAAKSVDEHMKDGNFALKALFKSKKSHDADFEAMNFSPTEKNSCSLPPSHTDVMFIGMTALEARWP